MAKMSDGCPLATVIARLAVSSGIKSTSERTAPPCENGFASAKVPQGQTGHSGRWMPNHAQHTHLRERPLGIAVGRSDVGDELTNVPC